MMKGKIPIDALRSICSSVTVTVPAMDLLTRNDHGELKGLYEATENLAYSGEGNQRAMSNEHSED